MAIYPVLTLLLVLPLLIFSFSSATHTNAFTSPPSSIGINYGQVADNLPPPADVLPLLQSLGVSRVKLYDADPAVLRAFASTDVELIVGLPDRCLPRLAAHSAALAWVKSNLQPYLPATKIVAVTVGNEVLSGDDSILIRSLLPAMQSLHSALVALGLERQVAVTTAHSLAVLAVSYPPSAAAFRHELLPYVVPLLAFLAKTCSPFLINAYPYFAYKADPKRVDLEYALFEPSAGVVDPGSGLRYENMLHAQVDAVRAAIAAAGGGKGVEVVVSETGWPSAGDEDEAGATAENARRYNGNLMRMMAAGKGTPSSTGTPLEVYVFALFNENLKPGPSSERHYGLFKPDGTPAYDLALAVNSSSAASSGSEGAESPSPATEASSTGYYTISSTTPYTVSELLTRKLTAFRRSAGTSSRLRKNLLSSLELALHLWYTIVVSGFPKKSLLMYLTKYSSSDTNIIALRGFASMRSCNDMCLALWITALRGFL
ncbi:glucan endo-1,3-beta-glucosidase 11-like [Canna indica]|uniref:glucan endo-1,3-beta-D-glucosidase n=1 Tax=Canna indica TaxID=4628 RepID=A0AAQ3QJF5_9LILI|nr:glucan endo-1,3-beta-glucosidase 11-like [Canna indica]